MLKHLVNAYVNQPWAIEPSVLQALMHVYRRKLGGAHFDGAALHVELGTAAQRERPGTERTAPRIGVIPIQGVIGLRASSLGSSVDDISADFNAALDSRDVDAILFAVDSPGGTIAGVPELAEQIRAARGQKPMLTFTDGLMASAAYWLGAQADEVVAAPSAEAGSIGVYMVHVDEVKANEQDGLVLTPISAGRYKLEGAPWAPLDAEAKAYFQGRVDEAYGWFVKAIAEARNDTPANVRNGYGEGRVLGAAQAKAASLIDRIGTFEDAVARLASKADGRKRPRADVLRKRLELDTV